jgi:hypothetical protein
VRLGELVTAEVVRAGGDGLDGDPLTALRAIRDQASVLDSYIRASLGPRSPEV